MSTKSIEHRSGHLVFPGERLGVIEEFTPNTGTYVKDGKIYSSFIGRALVDLLNKRVSVYPLVPGVKVPKVGSIVIGQVSNVQSENATLRIFQIGKKQLSSFFSGVLHISDVQLRYIESMFNVCKPGDIMRAKVISEKNRIYHLSTKDKNLGVLFAFCSQCGYLLQPRRHSMICVRCGKIEKRKIASDYAIGIG
ncbi:MAG: exosome complex RNA-binding protein Csl4 [Candidatus Bathyarchaeia archaeon]